MGATGPRALGHRRAHKPRTHFSSVELMQPVHWAGLLLRWTFLVTAGYGQPALGRRDGKTRDKSLPRRRRQRLGTTGLPADTENATSQRPHHASRGLVTDELQGRGHSDAAQSVQALAVAPKDRIFATAAGFGAKAELKLWNLTKELSVLDLKGHKEVHALAFSPDGAILAGAGTDGAITLWSVATGKERGTLRGHVGAVTALLFLPDGGALLSAGQDRTVRRWRIGE